MSQRKMRPGEPIRSLARFVVDLEEGRGVYYRHKYLSPKWVQHWTFRYVLVCIRWGHLFEAVPTREA